jgi:hypothetical protein
MEPTAQGCPSGTIVGQVPIADPIGLPWRLGGRRSSASVTRRPRKDGRGESAQDGRTPTSVTSEAGDSASPRA